MSIARTCSWLPALAVSAAVGGSASAAITTFNSGGDWNDAGNWDTGVPSGADSAIISAGLTAQVTSVPTPTYSGGLTLQTGAEVDVSLDDIGAYNALGTGAITLNSDSVIRIRTSFNNLTIANDIAFAGDASILNSSNPTDNESRFITGVLSGSGQFTYGMRRGNLLALGGASPNTISGGMVFNYSDANFGNTSRVRADKNGAFGTGDVFINDGIYLELIDAAVTDAIADTATLHLDDRGEHASPLEKVTLGAGVNEIVGGLTYVDYAGGPTVISLGPGTYSAADGITFTASDATVRPLFDGEGSITIVAIPEPASVALLGLGGLLALGGRRRR